jgi:hypothetical protein
MISYWTKPGFVVVQADVKQQELNKKKMEVRQINEPGPVYMHELRAMNQKVTQETLAFDYPCHV